MRRGPGLGAAARQKAQTAKIASISNAIDQASMQNTQEQLEIFQKKLEEFAIKYKDQINKNPIFRSQFQKMCKSIGVDPLASNKGVWGQSLTQMADFYYELGIQAIEACLLTKAKNGGMISIDDLITTIRIKRSNVLRITPKSIEQAATMERNNNDINSDDIKISLEKVSILGNSYKILDLGGIEMVVSVPVEFQTDHLEILKLARSSSSSSSSSSDGDQNKNENYKMLGCVTLKSIMKATQWQEARVLKALSSLIQEGMCWTDSQAHNDEIGSQPSLSNIKYWIPSIWLDDLHTKKSTSTSQSK